MTYAAATQEALDLLTEAEVMGPMIPREYGGLNVPETIFQMMVEIVSRAEAGLMNLYGLQEILAIIAEFADDELKARFLPRFARGEVTGAMALTEPDAGSDLGAVQTRATYDQAATGYGGGSTVSSVLSPMVVPTSWWYWRAPRRAQWTRGGSPSSWWRPTRRCVSAASKQARHPHLAHLRVAVHQHAAYLLGKPRLG